MGKTIIAADPGVTTGVAMLRITETALGISGTQDQDPQKIAGVISSYARGVENVVLIVEDFVGGGYRTKESKHTERVIGYLEWTFNQMFPVVLRAPQQRLKGTSLARKMAKQPCVDIPEPHSLDALKHCFAYAIDLSELS